MKFELNGFVLTFSDSQMAVSGPDVDICRKLGKDFLTFMKTAEGFDLLSQYTEVRTRLVKALDIPEIEQNSSLEKLMDWLRDNPDFIESVEEALEPYGYIRSSDN